MEKILRFDTRHGQRKEHPALRVLVVDDERDTALSLARLLELYGFEAYPVFDGPQALRMLQAHPPEVVLLDIRRLAPRSHRLSHRPAH